MRKLIYKLLPTQHKLKIIYNAGKDKLDRDFDLLKMIKDIKYLKMLTKFHIRPH